MIERRLRQGRKLDSRPCRLLHLPTVEVVVRAGTSYYTRYMCVDNVAAALQWGRKQDGRRVREIIWLT